MRQYLSEVHDPISSSKPDQPLFGKRILVTRSRLQAGELVRAIERLGGESYEYPVIEMRMPASAWQQQAIRQAFMQAKRYDWLVFTSVNGVKYWFQHLQEQNQDIRCWAHVRIVSVGTKTAGILREHGIQPDVSAVTFSQEGVWDILQPLALQGERVLLASGNLSHPWLKKTLTQHGLHVDEIDLYENVLPEEDDPYLLKLLNGKAIHLVTFTSSSTVTNLFAALCRMGVSDPAAKLSGTQVVCIGNVTAHTARKAGLQVDAIAKHSTIRGMVEAMCQLFMANKEDIHIWEGANKVFPTTRLRRLRKKMALRDMVRETELTVHDLIAPVFITYGTRIKDEISSMPGVYRFSLDRLQAEIDEVVRLGILAIILFGIPAAKDAVGSSAFAVDGIVQQATRQIKAVYPDLLVITDTCLCQYTDHGHCGIVHTHEVNGRQVREINNDESLKYLVRTAVSQAEAGADIIAPSNMMDGFVQVIRRGLDKAGFDDVPIMSYTVKYASAFYGPFRDAAHSTAQFGDRKTYQMDPANIREAIREAQEDVLEGADVLMVKPALAYMDVIRVVKEQFDLPLVAYNVSGEYSMVKAAMEYGWIDEQAIVNELLLGLKRAGADMIITYHAKDVARWLFERS